MSFRDEASLQDILLAAEDVLRFTAGFSEEKYLADDALRRAVERCYTIMGEAVKRVSPQLRAKHSRIPWSEIARMRDVLAHWYERVDHKRVWRSIQDDLPELVRSLKAIESGSE
jgi:uncharacterized protein with HEPN domain